MRIWNFGFMDSMDSPRNLPGLKHYRHELQRDCVQKQRGVEQIVRTKICADDGSLAPWIESTLTWFWKHHAISTTFELMLFPPRFFQHDMSNSYTESHLPFDFHQELRELLATTLISIANYPAVTLPCILWSSNRHITSHRQKCEIFSSGVIFHTLERHMAQRTTC